MESSVIFNSSSVELQSSVLATASNLVSEEFQLSGLECFAQECLYGQFKKKLFKLLFKQKYTSEINIMSHKTILLIDYQLHQLPINYMYLEISTCDIWHI